MNHISGKIAVKLNIQNCDYLQSCKTAKGTGKCNLSEFSLHDGR